MSALFDSARSEYGGVDILVNVVGGMNAYLVRHDTAETADADFDFMINLNLRSAFLTSRAALQQFATQEHAGVIVLISSISGLQSAPQHAAYGAAKAGVMSLTRSMAVEYGPTGVRVNAVAPGIIVTSPQAPQTLVELMDDGTQKRPDIGGAQPTPKTGPVELVPLRRIGCPVDIAYATLFLASDLSSYITGQTLLVDGGASVRWALGT